MDVVALGASNRVRREALLWHNFRKHWALVFHAGCSSSSLSAMTSSGSIFLPTGESKFCTTQVMGFIVFFSLELSLIYLRDDVGFQSSKVFDKRTGIYQNNFLNQIIKNKCGQNAKSISNCTSPRRSDKVKHQRFKKSLEFLIKWQYE